jgi:hypothetical protein
MGSALLLKDNVPLSYHYSSLPIVVIDHLIVGRYQN